MGLDSFFEIDGSWFFWCFLIYNFFYGVDIKERFIYFDDFNYLRVNFIFFFMLDDIVEMICGVGFSSNFYFLFYGVGRG